MQVIKIRFKETKMKIQKAYIIIGLIVAFAAFFELTAHADELDQTTILTFSQPIQIPGRVLPAGTYVFKLASSDSDRNLVEVFNSIKLIFTGRSRPCHQSARSPRTILRSPSRSRAVGIRKPS